MIRKKHQVWIAWSGGKDSALMLHELMNNDRYDVTSLLTALRHPQMVPLRAAHKEALLLQSEKIGIPIFFHEQDQDSTSAMEGLLKKAFRDLKEPPKYVAFGDIFLEDMRDLRERICHNLGIEAIFPLWNRKTSDLSNKILSKKFRCIVSSIHESSLEASFLGRTYDRSFINDLPIQVDPCGENGEFHTFVFSGPIMKSALKISLGSQSQQEGLLCRPILPRIAHVSTRRKKIIA